MKRWLILACAVALLAAILIARQSNGPIVDSAKLVLIKAEALHLARTRPPSKRDRWLEIPKREWPRTIADLRPERVVVHRWGVDISTKAYFDGGWGYHIPTDGRSLPMPQGCYSEPADGVFWHGPC